MKALYYPHEISEMLNDKIRELQLEALSDDKGDEELLTAVKEIRVMKRFVGRVAKDLLAEVEKDG